MPDAKDVDKSPFLQITTNLLSTGTHWGVQQNVALNCRREVMRLWSEGKLH